MKEHVSTADVRGWARVLGYEFAALDFTAHETLDANLLTLDLGPVRLTKLHTSACRFDRSESEIARSAPASAQLIVVLDGQVSLEQLGRHAIVGPGEACLAEPLHSCKVEFSSGTTSLALEVPRNLIALSTAELADLVAIRLDHNDDIVKLVGTMLSGIIACGPDLDAMQQTDMGASTVALTRALLSRVRANTLPLAPGLLDKIKDHIERELGNPRLSPASIAASSNISLRFLYRLFEGQSETVAAHVRRRRLESSRRDLADPALARLSITEVAQRWGMPDSSRFSQAFRKHFRERPSGYRTRAMKTPIDA